jgi:putative endonuclease
MWFSRKQGTVDAPVTTKQRGDAAEDAALRHLQRQGLRLVQRNFKTPGRGGGEVDLIMREPDGTLVFVEVRQRVSASRGGGRQHHRAQATPHRVRRAALFAATRLRTPMPLRCGADPGCLGHGRGTCHRLASRRI